MWFPKYILTGLLGRRFVSNQRFLYLLSQEDKDLVHEFVQNDGLACLIKVGNEADQNYQNYILRGECYSTTLLYSTPVYSIPSRSTLTSRRTYYASNNLIPSCDYCGNNSTLLLQGIHLTQINSAPNHRHECNLWGLYHTWSTLCEFMNATSTSVGLLENMYIFIAIIYPRVPTWRRYSAPSIYFFWHSFLVVYLFVWWSWKIAPHRLCLMA